METDSGPPSEPERTLGDRAAALRSELRSARFARFPGSSFAWASSLRVDGKRRWQLEFNEFLRALQEVASEFPELERRAAAALESAPKPSILQILFSATHRDRRAVARLRRELESSARCVDGCFGRLAETLRARTNGARSAARHVRESVDSFIDSGDADLNAAAIDRRIAEAVGRPEITEDVAKDVSRDEETSHPPRDQLGLRRLRTDVARARKSWQRLAVQAETLASRLEAVEELWEPLVETLPRPEGDTNLIYRATVQHLDREPRGLADAATILQSDGWQATGDELAASLSTALGPEQAVSSPNV